MHPAGEEMKRSAVATLRRMCPADAVPAQSILKESPEASIWSTESLLESIAAGFSRVAEPREGVPGLLAGFVIGRPVADEFEILNLAVAKAFRRRGIATQLVSATLNEAAVAHARQVFLEVRASNQGAIALYMRLGFRVCGRRPNYYRDPLEDALLLVWHNAEKIS